MSASSTGTFESPGVALDAEQHTALFRQLSGTLEGEVRFDPLTRTIYATDGSIYEITPLGVVFPRHTEDVVNTVNICREAGIPIIGRGAGTGLTGASIGAGVVIDFSRFMNRIGAINAEAQTVEVEPGVVLDDLNRQLSQHGLWFPPDVATASRATLGGMIGNNSCGASSIAYGRTVDYLLALDVVLSDGTLVTFHARTSDDARTSKSHHDNGADGGKTGSGESGRKHPDRATALTEQLTALRDQHHQLIETKFPKVLRSNGGYAMDRLGSPGTPANVIKLICGSEGTLGLVVRATLKVVPPPKTKALVVLHFADLFDALRSVKHINQHKPAAVELIDRLILSARSALPAVARRCGWLKGDPAAILVVEFHDDSLDAIEQRIDAMFADSEVATAVGEATTVLEPANQQDVWNLRRAGLGLLMSKPGHQQPYAFIEDAAVGAQHLPDYIRRVAAILDDEGVAQAGYYAHASVGLLHVRPVLNLRQQLQAETMQRIARAICDLVVEYGGAMTGEHGDGILRSSFVERLYGPELARVFGNIKRMFDPIGLMNPGKIVDPLPMTANLRYGNDVQFDKPLTTLSFESHGGMADLAGMCSGVGACRQQDGGTMCPSFQATLDETHTTRARANALRVALSNRGLLDGLADEYVKEVLDLCLSCKACKTECPTGVDMARLKYEFLSHHNLREGVPKRSRLIANTPRMLSLASRFPRISNLVMQSGVARYYMDKHYGMDARVPPPRLATRTFRSWFHRHQHRQRRTARHDGQTAWPRGRVAYFVDTWTNYFTPQVGQAAVRLLEAAGYEVVCPETLCCGRPAISHGLLSEAKELAEGNLRILAPLVEAGTPIVGTEPSCVLSFVDEYPQFIRSRLAGRLAGQSFTIERFLIRLLSLEPEALQFKTAQKPLLYHAHCHQRAIVGSEEATGLLRKAMGEQCCEIDSGCCGMAGSFGHESEHYDIAKAVGEQRLFPAVRERGDADVAVSGFSCRHQIAHHTDAVPKHVVEYLAELLA